MNLELVLATDRIGRHKVQILRFPLMRERSRMTNRERLRRRGLIYRSRNWILDPVSQSRTGPG